MTKRRILMRSPFLGHFVHLMRGDVRRGLPNSVHTIVENGFHETLPAREVQDIVLESLQSTIGVR
jgi:hypothetical protein